MDDGDRVITVLDWVEAVCGQCLTAYPPLRSHYADPNFLLPHWSQLLTSVFALSAAWGFIPYNV